MNTLIVVVVVVACILITARAAYVWGKATGHAIGYTEGRGDGYIACESLILEKSAEEDFNLHTKVVGWLQ